METHALRKAYICALTRERGEGAGRGGGEGGGEGGGWLSGYNFPLFLVYPVDMPE